ncbi:hypothetical protein NDU88_002615 [Pleurodeles waltl]|uniref:Uncharacterized protein n=1 Tax=Pleurodeles waltl TaxID=8319 RepID=A0AAV7Q6J3_PLEWA|nr:hypothetical protein NDU88_002615 [Pleurodeles waltl]
MPAEDTCVSSVVVVVKLQGERSFRGELVLQGAQGATSLPGRLTEPPAPKLPKLRHSKLWLSGLLRAAAGLEASACSDQARTAQTPAPGRRIAGLLSCPPGRNSWRNAVWTLTAALTGSGGGAPIPILLPVQRSDFDLGVDQRGNATDLVLDTSLLQTSSLRLAPSRPLFHLALKQS